MKKDTSRVLLIVVGVVLLLAVLGLGSAAWFFSTAIDVAQADEASAMREFERIRGRYAGIEPVLEIHDGDPVLRRRPDENAPRASLNALRLIHWDPDDESFTRVDLPFWFLRLKAGPIEVMSNNATLEDGSLGLTVEDLERLGPTLVIDHQGAGGDRLIMWTE